MRGRAQAPIRPGAAAVEGAVKVVEMRILATARDRVFSSLAALNTWLSEAIDHKHSVRYLRLSRLGEELALLQAQGRISHWLKSLGRIDVVILEDLGLVPLSPTHQPARPVPGSDPRRRSSIDWFTTPKSSS